MLDSTKSGTSDLKTVSNKPLSIGFGTGSKWQWVKKSREEDDKDTLVEELVDRIKTAIDCGVTHIDTAEIYTTHAEVSAAVKRSGKKREDLFITTKYFPGLGSYLASSKGPIDSLDKALSSLDTDYVDLFLVHSPFFSPECSHGHDLKSAWKEMIEIKKSGKARFVGVSNFTIEHLKEINSVCADPSEHPSVNQIEFHPYLQNQSPGIVDFCKANGIQLEAYGPLTPIFRIKKDDADISDHPLHSFVPELATKYGKTEAQVLLKYTLLKGVHPITTSSKKERIKQSLDLDFIIDKADIEKIDSLGSTFSFRGSYAEAFDKIIGTV